MQLWCQKFRKITMSPPSTVSSNFGGFCPAVAMIWREAAVMVSGRFLTRARWKNEYNTYNNRTVMLIFYVSVDQLYNSFVGKFQTIWRSFGGDM